MKLDILSENESFLSVVKSPVNIDESGKAVSHPFGFNGKEKDDEFTGNSGSHLDFGARMYDARVGRWWSTDALTRKFPDWSPYNYAINNPIVFTDPDGNDVTITVTAKKAGTTKINLYSSGEIKKDAAKKGKTKTVPVYEVSVSNESGSTATFYFTRDSYRGQSDGTVKEVTFNVRNDKDEFLGQIKSRWKGTDNVLEVRDKDDINNQSVEAMKVDVDAIRTAIQFHVKGASDGCLLCVGSGQFESIEDGVTINKTDLKANSGGSQTNFMSKINNFQAEDKKAKKGTGINIIFNKVSKEKKQKQTNFSAPPGYNKNDLTLMGIEP